MIGRLDVGGRAIDNRRRQPGRADNSRPPGRVLRYPAFFISGLCAYTPPPVLARELSARPSARPNLSHTASCSSQSIDFKVQTGSQTHQLLLTYGSLHSSFVNVNS